MSWSHAGELAALGTACCWTVTALAFERAGKRIGSLVVNLLRLLVALCFLTLFGALVRGAPLPLDASPHAWLWLGASGLAGFTIGDLCLFRAFVVIGARLSVLLMSLVPPLCALLGWLLLGEVLTVVDWLGMALTVGGVAWVVLERRPAENGRSGRVPWTGILLGIGGAAGQAVGLALSKYGMGDYDPFAATQIRVIAGALGFGLVFSVIGWWPRVWAARRDRPALGLLSLGGFFGPFLGVSLSLYAVQRTATGVAATIMGILPVLILPPAILLDKERVSPRAVGGAVLAVAGVAVLFL
ncbi:MAG: DMT family transporter [Deltaproteobacteria bacterium]|nr:DMT family transporter [Deltaproteobacteria bacterium]